MPPGPKADQWVEWSPPPPGKQVGTARLSERAVNYVLGLLHVIRVDRGLRNAEHDCLDKHQAEGLIRQ